MNAGALSFACFPATPRNREEVRIVIDGEAMVLVGYSSPPEALCFAKVLGDEPKLYTRIPKSMLPFGVPATYEEKKQGRSR